jgi:hypothetical protein
MMKKLVLNKQEYNSVLQQLNQYKIDNPEDHIDAMNIINETLNVGLNEINEAIKQCQDSYINYNYVDVFCEIEKKINIPKFNDSYLQTLIEQIDLLLLDSQTKIKKIRQTIEKNKIEYLTLELYTNQFFLETYLRALRDYI